MAKRGFFAELNHQAQLAEKRKRQQAAAAARAHNAATREVERTIRAAERAQAAAARASAADRKAAEKEAARLHVEARVAEVAAMNADLAATYNDLDNLLAWTLEVDDFVDLESLKVSAEHPPFEPGVLAQPVAPVPELVYPPEPRYFEPTPPKGLSGAFGGKKRHEEAVAQAKHGFEVAQKAWHDNALRLHAAHLEKVAERDRHQAARLEELARAEATYRSECAERENAADEKNEELSKFINDLAFDVEDAIAEYVGVVLGNSVYPEDYPVEYEHTFDLATRELTLRAEVWAPATLPAVKEYRYVKAKDEIAPTALPVKAQKDRYTSAVHQVAVRTLHEVFEADRAGKIHSIALTVGVSRLAPATGLSEFVPLVVVAADKKTFESFDLANVVPAATLDHLGAAVSKSPFDLTPADTGRGVRQRSQ